MFVRDTALFVLFSFKQLDQDQACHLSPGIELPLQNPPMRENANKLL